MRAIVQKEYGTADVLRVAEIDRPVIEAGEVLVQVRAAGLDRDTWHLMAGMPYAARLAVGLRAPKNAVPGLDVAGVVVAVGSEITRFQPSDEVFGIAKGSFAECARALAGAGGDTFLELGPGRVLGGLVRQTLGMETDASAADSPKRLEAFLEAHARQEA